MRGTLTGGSVGLLRYPAMLPCFSRLWGMILHCRKSPCRLEITADSRGLASGFSCLGDHPRVCGEHFVPTIMGSVSLGSSPRMRGTLRRMERDAHRRGIIPAYAGNTMLTRPGHTQLGDHPRVCGEHRLAGLVGHVPGGSSPRMRGTHAARRMPRHRPGIIPAYAGNTPMSWSMSSPCRDHPRVCGEHLFCCVCVLLWDHPRVCGEHGA